MVVFFFQKHRKLLSSFLSLLGMEAKNLSESNINITVFKDLDK